MFIGEKWALCTPDMRAGCRVRGARQSGHSRSSLKAYCPCRLLPSRSRANPVSFNALPTAWSTRAIPEKEGFGGQQRPAIAAMYVIAIARPSDKQSSMARVT